MANTGLKTIDEYILTFPKGVQKILEEVRQIVKKTAPEAQEIISYQLPTFKLNGKYLIYLGGWKDHISLYPTSLEMEASIKELVNYKTGKGTLQFSLNKSIPFDIIKKNCKIQS